MSCNPDVPAPMSDAELNRLAADLGVGPEPRHQRPKGPNRQARRREKALADKAASKMAHGIVKLFRS